MVVFTGLDRIYLNKRVKRVSLPKVCQIEIFVSDLSSSIAFYEKVLGWKKAPAYIHDFCVLMTGHDFGIALVPSKTPKSAPQKKDAQVFSASKKCKLPIRLTVSVESESRLEKVLESYGQAPKVLKKIIPGAGRLTLIEDPDGHEIGLFYEEDH